MEASLADGQTVSILSVMGRHAEGHTGELTAFRRGLYQCLTRWGDALFELCDAVLCAPWPRLLGPLAQLGAGVPPLPRQPLQGTRNGRSTRTGCAGCSSPTGQWTGRRSLLSTPRPGTRCDAECSPERGFYYSASKHSAGQPIVAGWSYQWICQLNFGPGLWTAPLDAMRIPP